jgi:conjugal transfer mating pair stabilization protein TraN
MPSHPLSRLQRFIVWCTLGCLVTTQAGAQSAAHAEGMAAGQAVQSVIRSHLNASDASSVVPGYTATPPERAHYGQPNLSGASGAHLAACALTPADPVCQALLGAQASAQTPREPVLPYDPAVLDARRVAGNPGTVLEDITRFYSGCQVDTVPTAATEARVCRQGSQAATAACARTLSVYVERTDSCAPGTWSALAGSDALQLDVQCRPDQPQQRLRARDRQAAPLVFNLDVGAARTFPQPVQALSPLAWGDAARWLWIVDDVCSGHDCQMTGYVAEPSRRVCRTEGKSVEVCTDEPPFIEDASRPSTGYRVNPLYGHNPALALRFTRPHTSVKETDRWDDQCPVAAGDGRCQVADAARCVDGPATKLIDGVPVTRACWRYDTALSCRFGAETDECAPLAAAGCTPTGSVCRQTHPATGACDLTENTYACPVAAATTATVRNCPADVFCVAGSCFSTAHPPDADFARTMTFLEAAREAGVYLDTDRLEVFRGEPNRCRDRLLKNCCMTDAAGRSMSNQSIYGTGSRLVYDVLMNSGNREFLYHGTQALLTSGGFSGSFSSYGVTVAVNGTALPAGSSVLYAGESLVVAFDPWSLVIAIVIYVVMAALSCDAEEGQLAMKEGARLCHAVGTYCSSCIRVHGRCVSCRTYTTNKCCFNSALARIIQEQGRQQLGKSWGGARNPDCSGFTVAQLQSLDFARMDLSEFYASIVPTLPNATAVQAGNTGQAGDCYYGEGRCP